ncbi:MAG: hypothetical protein IJT36_05395 [Alphaproteobacteria bacterium]|nr:hypothetical protein [Alphaproteobacteria bacterium]
MIQNTQIVDSKSSIDLFLTTLLSDIETVLPEDKFIAVDTEFIRENLDIPLLCLVQIATPNYCFVIDPLAVDISFLIKVFSDKNIIKVFHSAGQDIDVLYYSNIRNIENIYDTQLYEMLLSTKEYISYKSIVARYLKKNIDKNYVVSDWQRRPLSKEQLQYSIGDVVYLREVYKKQRQKLVDLGRIDWLKPEMEQLSGNNVSHYREKDFETAKKLSEWVGNRAKERNIDMQNIADERAIKRICRKGQPYIQKMLKYRRLINKDFRDFLLFAKDIIPDNHFDNSKQDLTTHALKLVLEMCSQKSNIAPAIIANSDDLENFIKTYESNPSSLRIMKDWRYDIFGKYAQSFLDEKLSITMKIGRVEFTKQ